MKDVDKGMCVQVHSRVFSTSDQEILFVAFRFSSPTGQEPKAIDLNIELFVIVLAF